MKKIIKYSLFLSLVILTVILYQFIPNKVDKIPMFSYSDIRQGAFFSNKDLNNKMLKLIVFFNPSCDDCEKEIMNIKLKRSQYENYQIILVSKESLPLLKDFASKLSLDSISNLVFLHDKSNTFKDSFKLGPVIKYPTIFVFGINNNLLFRGETMAEFHNLNHL